MKSRPHAVLHALLLAGTTALSACGGSSGSSEGEATLTVALTDAASDEIASFTVDVTSIQLTKANGAVAGVLATPVNVDLVTLQDLSQILSVASVPPGIYTKASVTFDFASAQCVLVGQTTPATLVDDLGNPLTGAVTLPLSLAGAPIDAHAGRHRLLELDFDLNQSLTVDSLANQVAVAPTLVVRFDRSDAKELIAMGSLVSVDTTMKSALVDLKTLSGTFLRQVNFSFDAGSVYQLDGVPVVGTNGLTALAAMPAGTWIQGYGAADPTMNRIDVRYVEAGFGTWNGGSDILEGHVVGRSGGAGMDATLAVLGRSQDASHSVFTYNTLFSVNLSFADTKVVRRGSPSSFDTDELNVGQQVRIFGALSGTTMDASGATDVVREQLTRVAGFANAAPGGGVLALDLDRIDLRVASDFGFSQGGPTPADPANLQLDVGSLADNLGIVAGTPVVADGFFSAFDDAGADFVATRVIDRDDVASVLAIHDRLLGFTISTAATPSQIQFTITGTKGPFELAVIDRGFVGVQDLPTSPAPTVVPAADPVVFIVRDALLGTIRVDADFDDFSNAIASALAGGRRLADFHAVGPYDATTNTLTAGIASAVLR